MYILCYVSPYIMEKGQLKMVKLQQKLPIHEIRHNIIMSPQYFKMILKMNFVNASLRILIHFESSCGKPTQA